MFCNDYEQKSRAVTQISWHISSTTSALARSTLCSNIRNYFKEWSENFANKW